MAIKFLKSYIVGMPGWWYECRIFCGVDKSQDSYKDLSENFALCS